MAFRPNLEALTLHHRYHRICIEVFDFYRVGLILDPYIDLHRIGPLCLSCRPRITACQGLTAAVGGSTAFGGGERRCARAATTAAAAILARKSSAPGESAFASSIGAGS